tara:strand:+ start:1139 stop:2692 length:1554 start_codon:yes stop_codon:yes gene_type:complete
MAKILFIHPYVESSFGRQSIPLALTYSILKKQGHHCEIFDTTFLDNAILLENRPNHDEELQKKKFFKEWDNDIFIKYKKKGDIFSLLQKKIDECKPDLITFSFWGSHLHAEGEYYSYHNGVQLINNVVINKESKVVVGGTIPSSDPKKVLEQNPKIDYVLKGEPELVYVDIAKNLDQRKSLNSIDNLNYLENDKLVSNKLRLLIDPLDQIPDVKMDIFDDRSFNRPFNGNIVRMLDFELSRGCWYKCTFCLSPFQRETTYNKAKNFRREKGIEKIIREISSLKKNHKLEFIRYQDESFNSIKEEKLKDLAKEYKEKVDLPFIIEATVNTSTENRIKYLAEMGCVQVGLGIESGSERVRDEIIIKPKFKNKQAIEVINCYKKHKIGVTAYNIIGFPTETKDEIFETIDLNRRSKPSRFTVSFFQPWEGTALKKKSVEEGFLDKKYEYDDGLNLGQQGGSLLKLNTMTSEELNNFHDFFYYFVHTPKKLEKILFFLIKIRLLKKFIINILDYFIKKKNR